MTQEEFYSFVARHDFYYTYSDDHSVWRRGEDQDKVIRHVLQTNPEYSTIYNAFVNYNFNGGKQPVYNDFGLE